MGFEGLGDLMHLALLKSTAGPSKLGVGEVFSYVSSDVRRVITNTTWAEIRTAYASGIGLRELARNMHVSENTVLSRAHREGWTRDIQNAKASRDSVHSGCEARMLPLQTCNWDSYWVGPSTGSVPQRAQD